MLEVISKIFDTGDFLARWHCGQWSQAHGWLHIASDVATWAAYTTIPLVLIYFVLRRRDVPFTKLFWLFSLFILSCGSVHLVEAIIFWHPVYRVSGILKLVTAIVSWTTVVALIQITPAALRLPGLARLNRDLEIEIAERKKTEEALRQHQQRYEALVAGTRSIVWTTNARGEFVSVQESWERFTGQAWREHKGDGWLQAIHPDDRAEVRRLWQQSLQASSVYRSKGRLWHAASQSYRPFIADGVPVVNSDGSIREWVGTVTDVHEQHIAEEALRTAEAEARRSEQWLRELADAMPQIVFAAQPDGRIDYYNQRWYEFTGNEPDGARDDDWRPILHPDDVGSCVDKWRAAIQSGKHYQIQYRFLDRRSGQYRWHLARALPVRDEHGTIVRWFGTCTDIHQQKRTEEKLTRALEQAAAANVTKSEFLANMSHEIRTPMTAIMGYADILLAHLKDADNRQCVLTVKRNGQHLLDIINDILDLSRIEAGQLEIDCRACSPQDLLHDLQSLMQVRADEKGIDLRLEFDGAVPTAILTDDTRLRQILINLVGNAIKFTKRGHVAIRTRLRLELEDHPMIEFQVQDTGIGMSEEQIEQIFMPFRQGDSSVIREYGGSGLGLAISYRLVEMLQGQIVVESTKDAGSTFSVIVPTGPLDDVELVEPRRESLTPDNRDQCRPTHRIEGHVLVVDDRRDMRYLTKQILKDAGARVTTAPDGQAALDAVSNAAAKNTSFDVILMDMQMPKIDGYAATSELRSKGCTTPIIALTADAMRGDRERCLMAGCDDYMSKPIDRWKLVELVLHYTRNVTTEALRFQRQARDSHVSQQAVPTADTQRNLPATNDEHQNRVLVVDDARDAAAALARLLELSGHEVIVANDGTTALQLARDFGPNVVLLDIGLPDIDGYTVARELRNLESNDGTLLIIAVSGLDDSMHVERARSAGFDELIVKPVNPDQLEAMICGSRQQGKQL